MKHYKKLSTYAFVGVLAAAVLVAATPAVQAQTYYQNYVPQTKQELINYLYALIAQLQGAPVATAPVPVYTYQPAGTVLGANTSFGQYNLEITTTGVSNIDDDEAWAFGFVELNGAPYATVFFEYGESRSNLNRRSATGRLEPRDGESFRADLTNLDRGEDYFYRAVAVAPNGQRFIGQIESFEVRSNSRGRSNSSNDDEPEAFTDDADDIDEDSAELNGEVEMNDFRNGLVFFLYGEDEDEIEDATDEDEFDDIDERGDDLQKIVVDRDLDDDARYTADIFGLDDDTEYFFTICVEYEDDDDDQVLECGSIEDFETDRD